MSVVGKQTARQVARRAARVEQQALAKERKDREKRLGDLGVEVAEELAQRDVLLRARDERILAHEVRAGAALRSMVEDEGLSVGEAVRWCGPGLEAREATRLRQLAGDGNGDEGEEQAPLPGSAGEDAGAGAASGGEAVSDRAAIMG